MSQIKTMLGKVNGLKKKRPASEEKLTAWSKDSIFFELDYWEKYETYLQGFKSRGKYCRIAAPTQRELDYIPWLRKHLENEGESRFKRLADGPSFYAKSYNSSAIKGYVFSTYDSKMDTTTQKSGVSMKAFTNFRASAKDKNLVEDEATYYGIYKQILELDYHDFKETFFFCDWVRIEDRRNGCYVNPDTNLVFVNLERILVEIIGMLSSMPLRG
ncbi:hypothetical protein IFM89_015874 [Coptis chinensis]|uniref:Uncharacterized protein n=1 Tax=Coptis chinensis TaxID=261450 RepID=A0A835M963_9MAGN|nr:hypothetical protein IFM89_015874 [Coptis chinensis]